MRRSIASRSAEHFEVARAGVEPTHVRPEAVEVMREIGVDISQHRSKSVDEFASQEFDYGITVCDNAYERCCSGLETMSRPIVLTEVNTRAAIVKRGRHLEYFTIGYNSLEGLIAVVAGLIAGSIALVGFGFDSLIEVTSGTVLLWRLHADVDEARRERIEAISLRIVGVCFVVLAIYVTYDSVRSLIKREAPEESLVGILLAVVSLVIMPLLVRAKRKVARAINSGALMADSKQTELCTYLSAILLGGLLLNALLGWWWADPVAALIMVPIIFKEGVEALRGETCCDEGVCH